MKNQKIFKKGEKVYKSKKNCFNFDECTSAFRETFGGSQKYKVNPDIAVFGKSIANGIPLTAVIGKKEIMDFSTKVLLVVLFGQKLDLQVLYLHFNKWKK